MIKNNFIDNLEDIKKVKAEWDELFNNNKELAVYSHFFWVKRWLEDIAKKSKPFIFLYYINNRLLGIFPIAKKSFIFFKKISFAGENEGDYFDFIINKESKNAALDEFIIFLKHNSKLWDFCDLKDFPETSKNYDSFIDLLKKNDFLVKDFGGPVCHYLQIQDDWDIFLKKHKRKFIYNINRSRQQLEFFGKLEFKKNRRQDDFNKYLAKCFDLHKKRWEDYYISSKFSTDQGRKFYTDIAEDFLKLDMIRFDILLLDGNVIAFSYSFHRGGKYFYHTPAYDITYKKYSPGTILLMCILEDSFENSFKEFDFSKGELSYKDHWSNKETKNRRVIFASPTIKGRVGFYIYILYFKIFSYTRKSEFLRRLLVKLR